MAVKPYLSVVVTSRNDGHGGSMLARFRTFADALVEQAERHGLTGELIIVEWNPPDGPPLRDVLALRREWEGFPVRSIVVPRELHDALPHADEIPLFQMIAKNVGIRRARGEFILATNPDLLFSEELIARLASRRIDPERMLRVDRTDVASEVPETDLRNQLAWCERNVLRINTRWGTVPDPGSVLRWVTRTDPRQVVRRLVRAVVGAGGMRPVRFRGPFLLRAWRFGRSLAALILWAMASGLRAASAALATQPKVHTNGCGDFTLLSREAWHVLRGYSELPIWSMHLDSLFCYQAVAAGYEEELLGRPARMFHIEHGSSWVTMSVADKLRTFGRKPWIDPTLVTEVWDAMHDEAEPVVFNDSDWGLGKHTLQEFVHGREPSSVPVSAPSIPHAATA